MPVTPKAGWQSRPMAASHGRSNSGWPIRPRWAPSTAIWVDANDPRVAVAVLGARTAVAPEQSKPAYVLRTMNGGIYWDDITTNLPADCGRARRDGGSGQRSNLCGHRRRRIFHHDGSGGSRTPHHVDAARRKSARRRGHGCETGCGRQSVVCGTGRIRRLCGHRAAPVPRCAGGERGRL